MNLGENIYRFRTERNMSQGALADALEVSRQSVSKWENNSATPELDKLLKMSELFGVTLDELVGGKTDAVPQKEAGHTPAFSKLPPRKIAAAILLACAFLVFLMVTGSKSPLVGLALAAPFLICSLVCFLCKRNAGVWCIWAVYLYLAFWPLDLIVSAYDIYFFNAYEAYIKYTLTIQFLALIGTLLLTFKQPVTLQKKGKFLLVGGWLIWILYFIERVLRYIRCQTETGIVFPFDLSHDPGFPLFVFLLTVLVRILFQRRRSHEPR